MIPLPPGPLSLEDRAAVRWFAEEVQPHEPALRQWLRTRFPWLGDIDNIAREAVVRVWRKNCAGEGASIKSPKALLFAIARNAACDQVGHGRRGHALLA